MKRRPIYTSQNPKNMATIVQRMVMEEMRRQKSEIEQTAVNAVLAAVLITLHDKYDWSKDELNEFACEITKQFGCVKEKLVTIEDFEQWCREFGIEI